MTPELLFLASVGLIAVFGFAISLVMVGIKSIRQDNLRNKAEIEHKDKQEQILSKGLEITIRMNMGDTKNHRLDDLFRELTKLDRGD